MQRGTRKHSRLVEMFLILTELCFSGVQVIRSYYAVCESGCILLYVSYTSVKLSFKKYILLILKANLYLQTPELSIVNLPSGLGTGTVDHPEQPLTL